MLVKKMEFYDEKPYKFADGQRWGFAIPPMHGVVYNLASTLQKETTKVLGMAGL
jgi:hypothetical protein